MDKKTKKLDENRVLEIAKARGEYAIQISWEEVLRELFEILEYHPKELEDFGEENINDLFDAVEYAGVGGFLHDVIYSFVQSRL